MKQLIKQFGFAAAILVAGALALPAQQRYGGGGGGGGGGGAGFGGFGGFGGNRGFGGAGSTTTSYNNNGTVGNAVITVDPDTHNIVVTADAVTAAQIRDVLAKLDAPKPQVLIKVVFMEVDHNNDLDIGVEGGWAGSGNGVSQSAGNIFGLSGLNNVATNFNLLGKGTFSSLSPGSTPPLASSGTLYQISGSDFQATLRAVAQTGKAQVLSRPSILARDGQLAQIVVGQSIYLPTGVTFASIGTGTEAFPTINGSYQNVGIILNVTPYIGDNRLVEMIVAPETSEIDTSSPGQVIASTGTTAGTIFAPNLDIRSADTVVVTPDAQPVVIGGLIGNDKSSSVTKVPLLGDIPFLGNLFKYTSTSDSKTELLIFLTPHIVNSPAQLVPMAVTETGQASTITNSVSEQELDQFLERVPIKKY
jgi:general secretion pathway protein D